MSKRDPAHVTIEFAVAGGPYCSHGCTSPSVLITDEAGHRLDPVNYCLPTCTLCWPSTCPPTPCFPDAPITTITRDWDGTDFEQGTCGNATACVTTSVVRPGTYRATLCVTPGSMSHPDAGPS